ncbi:Protein I'm not dead yet [Papilio xuthus]|uniref:Protein I'm not dead yet n=1 Tax=Papilio xuthus TaxID=66420 RepID=A0A194QH25_PAPXU|nr:Protein I'm not dead yet [Papilio xuthus]
MKIKLFLCNHWRGLICFLVPLLLIPVHFTIPTEDTIVMFLGSMFLAYAVEQSGLHKRLALCAVRTIGYSHYKLLFAMSFITMFISMWITNTAAATMMVPINFALLQVFEEQNILKIYEIGPDGENIASDITTCYFCASTFSATIGGIGTLVGTATNLVFKGLFNKPNSAAHKSSKITPDGVEAAKKSVEQEWRKLGRITFWEIMVIILFSLAIVLFFSRSPEIFLGWGNKIVQIFNLTDRKFVLDSAAVTIVCFLMLVMPSTTQFMEYFKSKESMNQPTGPIPSVLNWNIMDETMPYSFMFLLGGGFALSEAAKKEYSDLNGKIGQILKNLSFLPNFLIILLIIIFTSFITNFASNVAVCNVIAPIAMQLAKEIGVNPLWYNIAVGFTSSFCFLLPVGTPGNLVVQSAANIPTLKMRKGEVHLPEEGSYTRRKGKYPISTDCVGS